MPHTLCTCTECQTLDTLPVRRHGIPHARQATFLGDDRTPAPPRFETVRAIAAWESLPLFGGIAPDLFA